MNQLLTAEDLVKGQSPGQFRGTQESTYKAS
jgi:hypothetical protein